ncbi:MAG: hypothetical protein ABGY09_03615 [Euryarchaeota archaeon]
MRRGPRGDARGTSRDDERSRYGFPRTGDECGTHLTLLPVLLPLLLLLTRPATADVVVDVVPYVDSDAWSGEHVAALRDFLSWCERHRVRVAAFHYNLCERTAPGITQVIREFANRGVITLVGSHSASHAMGGLPPAVQYWELVVSLDFLRREVGRSDPVLSVPYWVLDVNTVRACAMAGVRVIVDGNDPALLGPEPGPWSSVPALSRRLVVGWWEVDGRRVYRLPAVAWADLWGEERSVERACERVREAVAELVRRGWCREGALTVWVLVHPWELARSGFLESFEGFLDRVRSGGLDFECGGVRVRFRLADPREVVDRVKEYVARPLPSPDLLRILQAEGFLSPDQLQVELVRGLLEGREDAVKGLRVLEVWRRCMRILWGVDGELLALTRAGRVTGRLRGLVEKVVSEVWNDVGVYSAIREWGNLDAALVFARRMLSDVMELAGAVESAYAELVASRGSGKGSPGRGSRRRPWVVPVPPFRPVRRGRGGPRRPGRGRARRRRPGPRGAPGGRGRAVGARA